MEAELEDTVVKDDGIKVGNIVQVMARTWPGINKPGGVGRITQLHFEDGKVTDVDLQYVVVGGRERRVPIQYVVAAPEFEGVATASSEAPSSSAPQRNQLRDRSLLLGRCDRCGSLRADCGSCDQWTEEERLAQERKNSASKDAEKNGQAKRKRSRATKEKDQELLSSSSDEDILDGDAKARRGRYNREKAHWQRLLRDDDDSSSSDTDSDDPILAKLAELTRRRRLNKVELLKRSKQSATKVRRRKPRQAGMTSLECLGEPRQPLSDSPTRTPDRNESQSPVLVPGSQSPMRLSGNVENVGDPDFSQGDDFPFQLDDSPRPERTATGDNKDRFDKCREPFDFPAEILDLDGAEFIQPEGKAAVEFLPRDIEDRTMTLAFRELPSFFDDLMTEMETDVIPDAKIDLEHFKLRLRDAEDQKNDEALKQLSEERIGLYRRLQQNVIKDGVDQCRLALRRMEDRRQFRRYKKGMTDKDRKQFRSTLMDARSFRYDELDRSATDLMQDAEFFLLARDDGRSDESDVDDDQVDASDSDDSKLPSSQVGSNPTDASFRRFAASGDDIPLPPFDPHMHATLAKSARRRPYCVGGRNGTRRKRKKHAQSRRRQSSENNAIGSQPFKQGQPRQKKWQRREGTTAVNREIHHNDPRENELDDEQKEVEGFSEEFEIFEEVKSTERRGRTSLDTTVSGCHFSGRDATSELQFSPRRRLNRKPIADRMQAFLKANAQNFDKNGRLVDISNDHENDKRRCAKPTLHLKTRRLDRNSKRQRADNSVGEYARHSSDEECFSEEVEDAVSALSHMADVMFRRLAGTQGAPRARPDSPSQLSGSIADSCRYLIAAYPDSAADCASIFDRIVHYVKAQTPLLRSDAVGVFEMVLRLLQFHGNVTILGIALAAGSHLALHIRLLICTLSLLKANANAPLAPQDGVVYKVFAPKSSKRFIEMVVLQMLDAIYAQMQPACWALSGIRNLRVVEVLAPLRDALATLFPLVETVATCIQEKLHCQEWRTFNGRSEAFVSAVDPSEFQLLLQGEASEKSPGTARLSLFKTAIPRCEIETIWFIFAFCAKAPFIDGNSSISRWRLIASLLLSDAGVLSKQVLEPANNEAKLPPSEVNIRNCQLEIGRLRTLLSTGSFNPLPPSDGLVDRVVRKSLLLQAQAYIYSSESELRRAMPTFDESDRKRLSGIWEITDLRVCRDRAIAILGIDCVDTKAQNDPVYSGHMTGKQLTSPLSGAASSLILEWTHKTPSKKARLSRLHASIRKLVSDFVASASQFEQPTGTENVVSLRFEDVFGAPSTHDGAAYAATAYREAATRISLNLVLFGSSETSLTKQVRSKVWETMADGNMMERHRCIVLRNATNTIAYSGDLFRLFSTAKTLAWLTDHYWGDARTGNPSVAIDDDSSALIFLLSCMASCLECACSKFASLGSHSSFVCDNTIDEVKSFSVLVSFLCAWMSELCIRSRFALDISSSTSDTRSARLQAAALELRTCALAMLLSPIRQCIHCLTNVPIRGGNSDLALQSAFGLLRAVVGLGSATVENVQVESTSASVSNTTEAEEDLFGAIDDSLFLDINVDTPCEQCPPASEDRQGETTSDPEILGFRDIWSLLLDIIIFAKPSFRYAVFSPGASISSRTVCRTVQGREIAAKNVGAICSCLAALTTMQKQDLDLVMSSLNLLTSPLKSVQWKNQDDGDKRYLREVMQCFYSEICCLSADFEPCDKLVRKRLTDIVEHFVEAMLDSNTLERFPSINLERIKANGKMKEKRHLSLANQEIHSDDDSSQKAVNEFGARLKNGESFDHPGPAYNSSHLWVFSESLGDVIARSGDGSKSIFAEFDMDSGSKTIGIVSLEEECLKRIALFRRLLIYYAKSTSEGALRFDALGRRIISCCTYQLVSISEGIRYRARSGREEGMLSFKHARLIELQSCYTELTATLFMSILQWSPSPGPERCEPVIRCVRENVISQALLGQNCDMHVSLKQLYNIATADVSHARPIRPLEEDDRSYLWRDLFFAVIRRSRQVVLHLAAAQRKSEMDRVYPLFNALLTASTRCSDDLARSDGKYSNFNAELIAKSMECNASGAMAISRQEMVRSFFQEVLDEYMEHEELSRGLSREEAISIIRLRHTAIEMFLVSPRLTREDVSMSKKKGIIRMLSHVLNAEAVQCSRREVLPMIVILRIAQGLATSLRSTFESYAVDDELVWRTFQCSKHLLNLPPQDESLSEDHSESLLRWSRRHKDVSDDPRSSYALYLWTFATWMNDAGKLLVGRTEQEIQRLQDFRSKATSLASENNSIWHGDNAFEHNVVVASCRLLELEAKVFVEQDNAPSVVNVYSRPKLQSAHIPPEGGVREWSPSSSVRRAAKEVQAAVISAL